MDEAPAEASNVGITFDDDNLDGCEYENPLAEDESIFEDDPEVGEEPEDEKSVGDANEGEEAQIAEEASSTPAAATPTKAAEASVPAEASTPAASTAETAQTPAEAAQTATPTVAPQTVGKPTLIAAAPASSEAAEAGYKTAAVVVGETPLRMYAKNERIIYEIQGILSRPGLLSGTKINNTQLDLVTNSLEALGFNDIPAGMVSSGFCMGGGNVEGYVTGNDGRETES
jgi:hypothetical protein